MSIGRFNRHYYIYNDEIHIIRQTYANTQGIDSIQHYIEYTVCQRSWSCTGICHFDRKPSVCCPPLSNYTVHSPDNCSMLANIGHNVVHRSLRRTNKHRLLCRKSRQRFPSSHNWSLCTRTSKTIQIEMSYMICRIFKIFI